MTVTYTEDDATRVAELRVQGTFTKEDYARAVDPLKAFIDRHGSVKLIEIVESFHGVDPAVLWPGIKFDWHNIQHISHVAVVTDIGWIGPMSKPAGKLISSDVRLFALDELDEARDWIGNV